MVSVQFQHHDARVWKDVLLVSLFEHCPCKAFPPWGVLVLAGIEGSWACTSRIICTLALANILSSTSTMISSDCTPYGRVLRSFHVLYTGQLHPLAVKTSERHLHWSATEESKPKESMENGNEKNNLKVLILTTYQELSESAPKCGLLDIQTQCAKPVPTY